MAKFSSNIGKVNFECLIHLLRYITDRKKLCLRYYAKIKDAPISDLLIHTRINNDNQLVVLSGSN